MTRICGIYYSTPSNPSTPLHILSSHLCTELVDLTATHTLTQIFCNPRLASSDGTPEIKSARYTFPLYESSAVTSFTAQVGDKTITGIVKPKEEAKATYKAAIAAGKVAALLEQGTTEIFTTSIGNIPAGAFVSVVIQYVHELKQDIEVEGVRLVIPTIIAPKYGWVDPDSNLYQPGWSTGWNSISPLHKHTPTPGISLEILATMSGPITSIQSPSHPISIIIGSHSPTSTSSHPHLARATLGVNSASLTSLGKDFTLITTSPSLSNPRAFLAAHPTLPTSTLMVTLAPKFTLPPQRPELVFIVDRSGSMHDKISTVRSALHLFLASLTPGTYFNICSFGSRHSFLWPTSREYSAGALAEAKKHVDRMDAEMGGTEMMAPCVAAVEARKKDLKTEILVLTDGEIWNTAPLFEYITTSAATGDIRFFSLGVGESVSHTLVEGISRAGCGYSQVVGKGENMQRKIMRMLKAALTPHVNDWAITWDGKSALSTVEAPSPTTKATISLFDPTCNPDAPPAPLRLPPRPPILQAPAAIPPLYPYVRTTIYFLLSPPATPPSSITLSGTAYDTSTSTHHPMSLSIPVHTVTSPGLYPLLGRKLLQDLEEGRSAHLREKGLTEMEGTDLAVMFGLASKWTSFVAVADEEIVQDLEAEAPKREIEDVMHIRRRGVVSLPMQVMARGRVGALLSGGSTVKGKGGSKPQSVAGESVGDIMNIRGGSAVGGSLMQARGHVEGAMPPGGSALGEMYGGNPVVDNERMGFGAPVRARMGMARNQFFDVEAEVDDEESRDLDAGVVTRLSKLQKFSGEFEMSKGLLKLLGLAEEKVDAVCERLGIKGDKERVTVFVTMLVVAYLEGKMGESVEEWELMADKARGCTGTMGAEEVMRMRGEAKALVDGS